MMGTKKMEDKMIRINNLLDQIKRGNLGAKKELDCYIDEAIIRALFTNQNGTIDLELFVITRDLRQQIRAEVYEELNRKNELGEPIERLLPKDIKPIIEQNAELRKKWQSRLDLSRYMRDFSQEERQGIERAINIIGGIYAFKQELQRLRNKTDFLKICYKRNAWLNILREFEKIDKQIEEKFFKWGFEDRGLTFFTSDKSGSPGGGLFFLERERGSTFFTSGKNPDVVLAACVEEKLRPSITGIPKIPDEILEAYAKAWLLYFKAKIEAENYIRITNYLPMGFFNSLFPIISPKERPAFYKYLDPDTIRNLEDMTFFIELGLINPNGISPLDLEEKLPKFRVAPPRLLYDVLANLLKRKDGDTDNKKIATALRYLILRSQGTEKEFLFKKFLSLNNQTKNYPDPDDENKFRQYVESLRVRRMKYKKLKPEQQKFYKNLVNRISEYAFPASKKTKR